MYLFALTALKRLLQTPRPNCGIRPYLSLAASMLQKFHFLLSLHTGAIPCPSLHKHGDLRPETLMT